MSDFVLTHQPCDNCGSSDAKSINADGWSTCFSCGHRQKEEDGEGSSVGQVPAEGSARQAKGLLKGLVPEELPKRRLTEDTCRRWGLKVGEVGDTSVLVAEYRDRGGEIVAQKVRKPNKDMFWKGDPKRAGLFGQHLWGSGRRLVVTEGEIDAASVSQIQGHKWPVVSIPNGAQGAKRDLVKQIDYLERFDEVVLMFDSDEEGTKGAKAAAEALGSHVNVSIARLPLKDPNEMLVAGRSKELVDAIFQASPYRPEGIMPMSALRDAVVHKTAVPSLPYPWEGVNALTHGLRPGEMVVITAGTGSGKSAIVREVAYYIHMHHQEKVGMLMLEEAAEKTAEAMVGLWLDHPLHLDRGGLEEADIGAAFDAITNHQDIILLDHFGSGEIDSILSRIRYMALAEDCRWIFLDHISILMSGVDTTDERKAIDVAMTRLRTMVQELGIGMVVVAHLSRREGRSHEEGRVVSLKDLRGSHSIAQLADMVIAAERDQQAEDEDERNTTMLRVLKNRYSGQTGEACELHWNSETGRLTDSPFGSSTVEEKDFA